MNKLPFEELQYAVEELYQQEIDMEDTQSLHHECAVIEALIEGAGWNVNEYWDKSTRLNDKAN